MMLALLRAGVVLYVHVHVPGDSSRVSLTEISLAPQEFDDYQIGVDAAITFCLKELRVIGSSFYST